MKIACVGGGPAGLYLGILVKRVAPEHDVVVYERNKPDDTFGFGVVFSDATLGHLAAADPESHAQITSRFARWDDIEIHVTRPGSRSVLRSTGHGFCGLERKALLQILQQRARSLGVRVEFEHEASIDSATLRVAARPGSPGLAIDSATLRVAARPGSPGLAIDSATLRVAARPGSPGLAIAENHDADVIVACDGVASGIRDALAAELGPTVDVRANKFVWLGCTVPYEAFTFVFQDTPHGLFRVHAYRYHEHGSTFIVECREPTWRAAGLATADEDGTLAILGDIFAEHLQGHKLVKNRSIWRNFPTVRCAKWHAGNVVLVGDAAHTAHFSIGSGTKLAMEDVIVLRDELLGARDIPAALAAYEAKRRPEVEALQAAAQASLEWFEGTERYTKMTAMQLTYSLMTRSLRVSHASVAKRDPHLAHGVELLLAGSVGIAPEPGRPLPAPTALPFMLGDRRAANRIAVLTTAAKSDRAAAGDDELVAVGRAAEDGAGVVVTPAIPVTNIGGARINTDDQAVAWRRSVDFAHGKGALVAARIATLGAVPGALEAAVKRAAFAGFDLLLLDPSGLGESQERTDLVAIEHLPAMVQAARAVWSGWIGAWIQDRPGARAGILGHATQLVRAGAQLLIVSGGAMTGARLPAAPLADRLRNELGVATVVVAEPQTSLPDLDAAIAAGRADLVAIDHVPSGFVARRP